MSKGGGLFGHGGLGGTGLGAGSSIDSPLGRSLGLTGDPLGMSKAGGQSGPQRGAVARPDLSGFDALLPQIQASILANQGQMQGIAGQLGGLAQGGAWNNFSQQQLGQFDVLAQQRQQAGLDQLSRQGITGTAAANYLNQQQYQTDAQRQALSGQLGQQGLQFQGQMLGMQEGALGQANQMGNDALTNTLAKPSIQIAGTAATNAGVVPPSKKASKR